MEERKLGAYYDALEHLELTEGKDLLADLTKHSKTGDPTKDLNEADEPGQFYEILEILPPPNLEQLYDKLANIKIDSLSFEPNSTGSYYESTLIFLELAADLKRYDPLFEEKAKLPKGYFQRIAEKIKSSCVGRPESYFLNYLSYLEQLKSLFPSEFANSEFAPINWKSDEIKNHIRYSLNDSKFTKNWEYFLKVYAPAVSVGLQEKDLLVIEKDVWNSILDFINTYSKGGLYAAMSKYLAMKIRPERYPKIVTNQDDWDFYKDELWQRIKLIRTAKNKKVEIETIWGFIKVANYLQNLEISRE